MKFHILTQTADMIRAYAVRNGIKPAPALPIAPGIEQVNLSPFAAIKFRELMAKHDGNADVAIRELVA